MKNTESIIIKEQSENREFAKTINENLNIYEKKFTIGYSTICKQGTLKIVSIMNFFQDAALEHADLMGISGFHLANESLGWVIFRYHIEIKKHPEWKENVVIRTRRFPFKNLYEIRVLNIAKDVENTLKHQNDELVNATGCWIMINKKNGKPVRLNKFKGSNVFNQNRGGVTQIKNSNVSYLINNESSFADKSCNISNSNKDEETLDSFFPEVYKPNTIHYQLPFKVRMHDLDLNGHVNNAIFVEWGVETVPEMILSKYFPAKIDIVFSKESLYGDIILSHTEIRDLSGLPFTLHSIIRQQDQVELARLNICWHFLEDKKIEDRR